MLFDDRSRRRLLRACRVIGTVARATDLMFRLLIAAVVIALLAG